MIKLLDLLFEAPAKPAPSKPERTVEPDVAPGAPKTTPQPRRRSVPNPGTSPTPKPKAEIKGAKKPKPHQAPKPKDKQGPSTLTEQDEILKKIINRYADLSKGLHEIDYKKIFDPETLDKLQGSVLQRIQGKNPMQVMSQMSRLAMQIMQLEKGNEDLLEQLAYDVIYEAYPYLKTNEDVIEIDAKIVPQNEVKDALNSDEGGEDIDNLSQEEEDQMLNDLTADLKKRRLINSITQGGSTFSKTAHYLKQEYIDIIGGEGTSDKYRDLMQSALDMIDIIVAMSGQMGGGGADMSDSAIGAESVFYDFEKEKWIIKARAVCFPVLILEIVKGMYEIIGLFGFSNLERGEKTVGKVDKIENEPEDIAYGQLISKNLFDLINKLEANVTPEERDDFLQDIYKLDNDEFIKLITNVINNRVTNDQINQLKGMFSQMRQDKTADDADSSLMERWKRIAGLI